MIIGTYPCCDAPFVFETPQDRRLPAFIKESCPHCGTVVWHKLSRVDPTSWTEADFLLQFTVDEATREIIEKV